MSIKRSKIDRRLSAEKRATERWVRTDKEQIKRLDKKFGKGKGAVKERKRLGDRERKRLNGSPNDKSRQNRTAN